MGKMRIMDTAVLVVTIAAVAIGIGARQPAIDPRAGEPCDKPGVVHEYVIEDGKFNRPIANVQRCDTVNLVNTDDSAYLLAFGDHSNHIYYPGFPEQLLKSKGSVSFNAVKTGKYELHDHYRDTAALQLNITPQES